MQKLEVFPPMFVDVASDLHLDPPSKIKIHSDIDGFDSTWTSSMHKFMRATPGDMPALHAAVWVLSARV